MMNKKAMEMKVIMSMIFVLLVLAIILFFIGKIGNKGSSITNLIGGLF